MEKVMFLFMFSCWIRQIVSNDASVRGSADLLRVQMGENVILNCSMKNRYEITWYLLRSEHLDLLISGKKDRTGTKLLIPYNGNSSRLRLTADAWITRVSLIISGVSEADLGFYFCGTKSDAPEMFFDKPIRLEDHNTDGVTLTERVLMFGGVGLAIFVFFLTTVIAAGIIHHHGWQKGWTAARHTSLINHKSAQ